MRNFFAVIVVFWAMVIATSIPSPIFDGIALFLLFGAGWVLIGDVKKTVRFRFGGSRPRWSHYVALPPLIVLLMLVTAVPTFAQGVVVGTPSLPPLDMNSLASQFVVFIFGLLSAFLSSPATTIVVSWLKRIPALDRYPSTTLAGVVSAVLMLALALAIHFGVEGQFRSIVDVVTAILTTLGGMSINLTGSAVLYNAVKAQNVAVIGYSRSNDAAQSARREKLLVQESKPPAPTTAG